VFRKDQGQEGLWLFVKNTNGVLACQINLLLQLLVCRINLSQAGSRVRSAGRPRPAAVLLPARLPHAQARSRCWRVRQPRRTPTCTPRPASARRPHECVCMHAVFTCSPNTASEWADRAHRCQVAHGGELRARASVEAWRAAWRRRGGSGSGRRRALMPGALLVVVTLCGGGGGDPKAVVRRSSPRPCSQPGCVGGPSRAPS